VGRSRNNNEQWAGGKSFPVPGDLLVVTMQSVCLQWQEFTIFIANCNAAVQSALRGMSNNTLKRTTKVYFDFIV